MDEATFKVTGLLDFEGTTVSPLWECATIPRWLQDVEDEEGCYEGGTSAERAMLRETILTAMLDLPDGQEWLAQHELGRKLRPLTHRLHYQVGVWADLGGWVEEQRQTLLRMQVGFTPYM